MEKIQKILLSTRGYGIFNTTLIIIQVVLLIFLSYDMILNENYTIKAGLQTISAGCFICLHTFNLFCIIPNPKNWWVFFTNNKMWFTEIVQFKNPYTTPEKLIEIKSWLTDTETNHVILEDMSSGDYNNHDCVFFRKKEDLVLFKLTWYEGDYNEAQ